MSKYQLKKIRHSRRQVKKKKFKEKKQVRERFIYNKGVKLLDKEFDKAMANKLMTNEKNYTTCRKRWITQTERRYFKN